MPEMIKGKIDDKSVKVPKGTILLLASRNNGIDIPSLCHHEGLPPDGNCRVCLSEIEGKLVASCMYPLRTDGFEAFTRSEKVLEARAFVIMLLLKRAPKAPRIIKLAKEYNVEIDSRFTANPDGCIRCARCQRICKIQSSEAIALVGRSSSRSVTGPFHRPPEDCLGCLACAINCPAGCISFKDDGFTRTIWEREFTLLPCPVCGERVFTKEQLDFFHVESPLCPECRKRAFAKELKKNEFIVGYKAPHLHSHLAFEKTK